MFDLNSEWPMEIVVTSCQRRRYILYCSSFILVQRFVFVMSITLDTASCAKALIDANIHLMPCEIEHEGDANVDDYLLPTVKNEGNGYLTAAFRGRPLKGEKFRIPEGYTGIVAHEPRRPFVEDEERTFKISHQFNEFTFWNLDIPPNADDKIKKAMAWIDIAKAIHRPVDEESSQKSVTGK